MLGSSSCHEDITTGLVGNSVKYPEQSQILSGFIQGNPGSIQ